MSLNLFAKSITKGEILKPVLRAYLIRIKKLEDKGLRSRKKGVMHDAKLTIKTFEERIKEFNHGEDPEGELFHPSQIGGCLRRTFFDNYEAPRDRTEPDGDDLLRSHMIFEVGTYTHVLIQNLCSRAGVLIRREFAIVDKELKIIGHADGVLKIGGKKYVLEIKTINSVGCSKLDGPKYEHKGQATAYMKSLGVHATIFLYFDKDKNTLKEYVYEYDEKFYQDYVRHRIDKFFDHIHRKTLPEREGENPRGFPCMYCDFKRVCFESALTARFEKVLKDPKKLHKHHPDYKRVINVEATVVTEEPTAPKPKALPAPKKPAPAPKVVKAFKSLK